MTHRYLGQFVGDIIIPGTMHDYQGQEYKNGVLKPSYREMTQAMFYIIQFINSVVTPEGKGTGHSDCVFKKILKLEENIIQAAVCPQSPHFTCQHFQET